MTEPTLSRAWLSSARSAMLVSITTKSIPTIKNTDTNFTNYKNNKGLPYNDFITINDVSIDSGEYIIVIDENIPCPSQFLIDEYKELKTLLTGGVHK